MKILTVVGARPQFIKAVAISRAIEACGDAGVVEVLVHTGQHYDAQMSDVFFDELGMRPPSHNLGIAGGTHGEMTGRMLIALEQVMFEEQPDWVLIYGDTNSTLAAALAASKLHIPVAHVEAGLRSFNMRMPEEINRIVADRLSSLLLCPTEAAVENLRREGTEKGVHLVGDVMFDVALHFAALAEKDVDILSRLNLAKGGFALATCHRAENTDEPARLKGIVRALATLAAERPVVLPLHPRTRLKVAEHGLSAMLGPVTVIEPVSYLEMVALERNAELILTDSGGVQKEAFFYRVPCVTMREETEWVETVDASWNILAGSDADAIVAAAHAHRHMERQDISPYGDGRAAGRILETLLSRP